MTGSRTGQGTGPGVRLADADRAVDWIAGAAGRGGVVHVGGCAGEPLALARAFRARPGLAAGLRFCGVWIPGVNRTDWAGLHPEATAETIFASPDWEASRAAGRLRVVPETYFATAVRYAERAVDVAVVQVAPPDAAGRCCLGVAADFGPAVLTKAKRTLALVNPALPRVRDGVGVSLSRFDAVAELDHPLTTLAPPALDAAFAAIANHVRGLLRPGDTLQFGLGKVQAAVSARLDGLRNLRIHSGMVSGPVLDALDKGCIADAADAVTAGVALGIPALYDRIAQDDRVRFRPVGFTHDIRTLAAIPRLVAINSAIEVDLFGQGNAEFLGGRPVSGGGGLLDFLRGARLSAEGRPIVALASTGAGGTVSRIVPRLGAAAVTIPRADMALVVTEHGVADLRGLGEEARATALIGIADPRHRAGLDRAWRELRSVGRSAEPGPPAIRHPASGLEPA